MFKEFKENILAAIKDLNNDVRMRIDFLASKINADTKLEKSVSDLSSALEYQTRYTNTLLNHLYGNDKTLEAVVFIPYRGRPVIFKDGKEINTDTVTSFNVDWGFDRKTEVTINHE